jgi:hypothetical protein
MLYAFSVLRESDNRADFQNKGAGIHTHGKLLDCLWKNALLFGKLLDAPPNSTPVLAA